MATRYYVIDKIVYNDKIMNYLPTDDNPISNNLDRYYNPDTDMYYLNEDDFQEFKKAVEEDLQQKSIFANDYANYRKILKNMEQRIIKKGEIEIVDF